MVLRRIYAFPISGFYRYSMWNNNNFFSFIRHFRFHERMLIWERLKAHTHTHISHICINASAYALNMWDGNAFVSCTYAVGERQITKTKLRARTICLFVRLFAQHGMNQVLNAWNKFASVMSRMIKQRRRFGGCFVCKTNKATSCIQCVWFYSPGRLHHQHHRRRRRLHRLHRLCCHFCCFSLCMHVCAFRYFIISI